MSQENIKCQYFVECGGCKYLDQDEDVYQKNKGRGLSDLFASNNIDLDISFKWIDSLDRRKVVLHIDKDNKMGYFKAGSKQVIAIDKCYVAQDEINKIIPHLQLLIKSISTGAIAKVQITNFDNSIDLLFFTNKELTFQQQQKIVEFSNRHQVNTGQLIHGQYSNIIQSKKNNIGLENDINLDLDSNVFLQASTQGLSVITNKIRDFVVENFDKKLSVVDLYSGFGLYGFAISDLVNSLHLYEGSQSMSEIANRNIKSNSLSSNIKTHSRDLFNFPLSYGELKQYDLVIINPPRNGASNQIKEIAQSRVENLIYVSCNPKTFIRDYKIMQKSGFAIKSATAIDQFYSTDHFELVTILTR